MSFYIDTLIPHAETHEAGGSDPVNSASGIPLFIEVPTIIWNSTTQITVNTPCKAKDDTDTDLMELAANSAIDCSSGSGLGHLDTGSLAVRSKYYVYETKNPTTKNVGVLASLSSTWAGVSKPAGYTLGRRIGCFITDASAAIMEFSRKFNGKSADYFFLNERGSRTLLAAGTATIYTDVDCSNYRPVNCNPLHIALHNFNATAGGFSALKTKGATNTDGMLTTYERENKYGRIPTDANSRLQYKITTGASCYVILEGFAEIL